VAGDVGLLGHDTKLIVTAIWQRPLRFRTAKSRVAIVSMPKIESL
jgi:hypothetical protein